MKTTLVSLALVAALVMLGSIAAADDHFPPPCTCDPIDPDPTQPPTPPPVVLPPVPDPFQPCACDPEPTPI